MILSRAFHVPSENNFYEQMRQILMGEFGLVCADPDKGSPTMGLPPPEHPALVWEDEQRIGRYRVHLFSKQRKIAEKDYDLVVFHYWLNHRMCREIMEKDPMKPALGRTLSEAGDYIIHPHIYYQREASLEEVIDWIDEEFKERTKV